MSDTPRLTLPEIATGQSDKSGTHNDALQILDILVQTGVVDKDLTAPPGSPTTGAIYIVAATGTGDWAGHDGDLAYYRSGWVFIDPWEGLTVWVNDEDVHYTYTGAAWVNSAAASLDLDDLADVAITGVAQGDILRRNGSSQWVNEKPPVWIGTDRSSGAPAANQVMMERVLPATIVLPAGMATPNSYADASIAATAQTDFDVRKNGSNVGTIRFAAAGTVATFIAASPVTFNAGDKVAVVAPNTPDATLAGVVMTLAFTRS